MRLHVFATLALLSSACSSTPKNEGTSSSAASRFADGTDDAKLIVAAANKLDATQMRAEAGLKEFPASSIATKRAGADGLLGTLDDKPFTALKEVDDATGVGDPELELLLRYAKVSVIRRQGLTRLRLLSGNLTSGPKPFYENAGTRILQGLKADVMALQEALFPATDCSTWAKQSFGDGYNCAVGSGTIPNAVVTRYPITASGEWEDPHALDRKLFWARVDLPGDRDLVLASVHLKSGSSTNIQKRTEEAAILVQGLTQIATVNDFVSIAGDFNTNSDAEAALTTLSSTVLLAPQPADANLNSFTNRERKNPYDWVLANAALERFHTPVVIGDQTFPRGLVFDSRVYTKLQDVAPVLAQDSAAPNMQHMPVVRDFLIDGPATLSP